ncbi:BREX-1 system adenine-specific DNA-methyltransferase PglX [Fusobacterium pseudoperiodonticum]|uniref:site-specific DNA-methyltransferase (adenine-specific) n=1 Tax=Fusobacterium pseudoperiodonticum TaxID=2663009 RepID=A0AAD0F1A3_9FUSO|nr:BREX-1 system adenine-specific DNA-methyltransferase PglX [Fusobacterium pseudoperiodonticum]ATV35661.1 restriction endonuclease [Fusobacterium pseudoperiodonticum]ATV61446.1 restriction endonuclease [Fusobacterium pseudoperiodonticum]
MNKTSLKLFAIEARNELMEKMRTRLDILGITKNGIEKAKVVGREVEINGSLYPKGSYNSLVRKYKQVGYEELVEESAYTWFNRLTALAFMEANEYIDEKMIFNNGLKNEPGIIDNYYDFEFFKNLDSELQKELHDLRDENTANSIEKLYSILVEEKCEELSAIMPFMFKKKGTYSDILFPTGLLLENSLLVRIREEIGKEAPIELIGWLYQFYNSEKKDEIFAKKERISKENVPAVTQLFTPDWIVKYMVENSLGKLALESTGINENLKDNWKYYIESELDKNSEKIKIEDVKILDPAMGSGHILVYAFDLLFEMYENLGWSTKDTVLSILKNNLYGLEIDERAGQLASFALMMKAREKFSRLFSVLKREETFKLNTLIIEESNSLSERVKNRIKANNLNNLNKIIEDFEDAKEYGSILKLETIDKELLEREFNILKESFNNNEQGTLIFNEDELDINIEEDLELIESLIRQHITLVNQYETVVTNPPYMGGKGFSPKLKTYVEENYKDTKSDLFAVFIERCNEFTKKNCYTSMITMQSWMFLSSFENLRKNIIEKTEIKSLNHLGTRAFSEIGGEVVSTVAWVSQKKNPKNDGTYLRLVDYNNADLKEEEFFNKANYFQAKQKDFEKIPGSPIAYWVSDKVREIFEKNKKLGEVGEAKQGLATADNNRFLRLWNEVSFSKIGYNISNSQEALESKKKWFPFNKGGEFRKWYGNQEYLVNWENDGYEIKNFYDEKGKLRSRPQNTEYYFKESISWGLITSAGSSFRYFPKGFIYDVAGMSYFLEKNQFNYLGILNTKIYTDLTKIINPTINLQVGDVLALPATEIKNEKFNKLVQQNINISKKEWDSRETSWDFERLSLIDGKDLRTAFENYCSHWRDNFVQLHKNEEELNRLFIEIYELQDEMDEKVSFDDITILKKEAKIVEIDNSKAREFSSESEKYLYDRGVSLEFNKDELVKQFLSYAIGCIMGRYSTNKPGLIMANSDDVLELSSNKFLVKDANGDIRQEVETKFLSDEFGILPITAEKDFSNDIVERVKEFVKFVYGEESLKDNLNFIAEALGNKDNKNPEEIIRTYFIKDFYADHLQRYQKRPIYWLTNSGKKNALSCLFYIHRYEPLTVARVRADYLIPYQEMLENKRKFIERQLYDEDISAKEKKNVEKELKDLDILLKELRDYANEVKHIAEQKIPLDLDDGVNVNYEKLEAILKKR